MAARFTPPQAKNFIRRSLKGVYDSQPTKAEVAKLRAHFGGRCAFCDVVLPEGKKGSHLDHLNAAGPNHVSNRVPACATCNEVEKRELPWEPFLREKAGLPEVFVARRDRILTWIEATRPLHKPLPKEMLRAIRLEEARALASYEASLAAIRAIVASAHAGSAAVDDASLGFLGDLYEVVNACALRFDGYRYEALNGRDASLPSLANRFCETRTFSAAEDDNHATFFALQRYLFKWGGEQLPYTSPEHRAYRALYIRLHRLDVAPAYRLAPYYDEWRTLYCEHAARVADALDKLDPT